jgi:hypothetical protein
MIDRPGRAETGPVQCTHETAERQNFPRCGGLLVEDMKLFAGLETNRFARGDAHFGAGTRITPDAGLPGTDIEDAKAAQFDPLAVGQSFLERLKNRVNGGLRLVTLQPRALDHLVNDVLFYQGFPPSGGLPDSGVIVESFCGIVNGARVP